MNSPKVLTSADPSTSFGITLRQIVGVHLLARPNKMSRYAPRDETLSPLLSSRGRGTRDVVHLKGPFISTCVYCPSCVWPRISLLRFVSPLQRSQCIFSAFRRGRIWHFDVVPRKGRREINDYTHRHMCGTLRQRKDTIPLFSASIVPRHIQKNRRIYIIAVHTYIRERIVGTRERQHGDTNERSAKAYSPLVLSWDRSKGFRGERECFLSMYWWDLKKRYNFQGSFSSGFSSHEKTWDAMSLAIV